MEHLYPLLFEENLHETVWGGSRIARWKGLPAADHIGESWEVSAVPASPCVVKNGAWAGSRLTDVIAACPEQVLGRAVCARYGGRMPLLVKFIDARGNLSVQVHPDDAMAQREHGKFGKTEMWYVLDAEPGACLYSGFRQQLSPEEYKRKVADGTLVDALARHEVHKGDVFYIPAGRIHAICSGVLLAEVQQSSDVTYRIYDYGRPGLDGRPRELHTGLAAQALDYQVEEEYRTDYHDQMGRANRIIDSPFFSVRVTEFDAPFHRNLKKYDSFIISMCLMGDCRIRVRATGDEVLLREGWSCMVPAAVADYDILPASDLGRTRVLDAFIDNMDRSLAGKVMRFLHISQAR